MTVLGSVLSLGAGIGGTGCSVPADPVVHISDLEAVMPKKTSTRKTTKTAQASPEQLAVEFVRHHCESRVGQGLFDMIENEAIDGVDRWDALIASFTTEAADAAIRLYDQLRALLPPEQQDMLRELADAYGAETYHHEQAAYTLGVAMTRYEMSRGGAR